MFSMKRKVKVKVETTVEIDVDLLDTFNCLKWGIKEKLGIPLEHQQLKLAYRVDDPGYEYFTVEEWFCRYTGRPFDHTKLIDIQKPKWAELEVTMTERKPKTIRIVVETPEGEELKLEVTDEKTPSCVMTMIDGTEAPNHTHQLLMPDGVTLLKYDTLFEQKVKDGTRLKLVKPNLGQMAIFVKFMTGKTVALNVEGNFKPDRVKSLILTKEGILPQHQHFIFEDCLLLHDSIYTLSDYGVKSGSVLHLALDKCYCCRP
ncbi:hypothetical protein WR25_07651 [Diploscapter pachys]|uniref:Ubiquitin-like domain-containing protein n=1 Tax=Diploscapter pachys TaxID=2018661 RepID=A0A2A2LV43_9BILA|nr:hypothetical protein WR25_07651 [Diploscapter pachys]